MAVWQALGSVVSGEAKAIELIQPHALDAACHGIPPRAEKNWSRHSRQGLGHIFLKDFASRACERGKTDEALARRTRIKDPSANGTELIAPQPDGHSCSY